MKKSLLSIGRPLKRNEQQLIKGGRGVFTTEGDECGGNEGGVPNGCPCAYDAQCASGTCEMQTLYSGVCVMS